MDGRTTRLDPRTNDPYFGRKGKLQLTNSSEDIKQRLDILMHTHVGSIPTNLSYGIDYKWIAKNVEIFSSENALLMELINRIQLNVEPAIESFEITSLRDVGNILEINMTVKGRGAYANTKVSL
jgi:hypothetical protein